MTAPIVILPPSAAIGIEARSKVERQALFHIAGTGLWARNGATVRLAPILGSLILALAGSRGQTLAYGAAIDAVWGDDPDGGPLDCMGLFNAHRSKSKDDLSKLGISVDVWWGCGFVLNCRRIAAHGGPRQLPANPASGQHWLPLALAMKERGASYGDIATAMGRHITTVRRACLGVKDKRRNRPKTPTSTSTMKKRRLRREAQIEAKATGVGVEQIYAAWDCAPLVRSRVWDQRRATTRTSEASP